MPADSATHDLAKLRIERDRHDVGPRRRSRTPAVLVLLILVGAALAVWWFAFRDRLPEVATTRVVEVTPTEGNAVLTASGYVVAQRKVILGAKSPRRLVERLAGEGDRVQEGQIVARLDHRDVDGQLAQAKAAVVAAEAVAARADAAVMRAERNLEGARAVAGEAEAKRASDEKERDRLHQLGEGGGVDRRSIDLADAALLQSSAAATATKARIASAEADLEWTKRDLAAARADVKVKEADIEVASSAVEDTIIRAPFAGVVLLKQAEIGESVSPGVVSGQVTSGSIFQIADFDTLEAEVDVNEANLSRVRDGQPAAIQVDAIPERAFAGEVRLLMPGANRQKATVAAKVRFLEKDPRLKPELGCKVSFLREAAASQAAPKLLVPASAIVERGGTTRVFVLDGEKARSRAVAVGERLGDRVEIRDGLRAGEEIVVGAPDGLADGASVRRKTQG